MLACGYNEYGMSLPLLLLYEIYSFLSVSQAGDWGYFVSVILLRSKGF